MKVKTKCRFEIEVTVEGEYTPGAKPLPDRPGWDEGAEITGVYIVAEDARVDVTAVVYELHEDELREALIAAARTGGREGVM